jgi:excisionase family DNA binding protein
MSRGIRKGAGPPEQASAEIMTVQEVAEYLLCHPYTVHRLLRQREIPGFKLRGDWRLRRSDIERWILDRQSKPEAPTERKSRPR